MLLSVDLSQYVCPNEVTYEASRPYDSPLSEVPSAVAAMSIQKAAFCAGTESTLCGRGDKLTGVMVLIRA